MENLNDIFNLPTNVSEITNDVVKGNKSIDENLYSPSLDDAADGVYKATIRFLPNINDIKLSTISKYVYFLTDVNRENGFFVDDPTTVGEKSPIGNLYWKLYNSSNAVDKELSKQLNRNYYNYSLIEIVKDVQHPELEGQIKVFKYGVTIKNKIDDESNSEEEPCNVFDLYSGKNFNLIMEKKQNFNNYDRSKFSNSITPISINGKQMGTSNADREKIIEFLKGSPDLSKYMYKEWDDETREKVYKHLRTYTGDVVEIDKDNNPIEKVKNQAAEKKVNKAEKMAKIAEEVANETDEEEAPSNSNDDFFNMDDIEL